MAQRARIYQKPKTSMQSGSAGSRDWLLTYEQAERRSADPLMGWLGSRDTQAQVTLAFDSSDDAVAYARAQGLAFDVEPAQGRTIKPKAYADNFRTDRGENWTH